MTRPLAGLGVLLTRPAAQAGALKERLQAEGASVHSLPVLDLSGFEGPDLNGVLSEYSQAAMAIFVSANAVHFGLKALAARDIAFASGPQLAAVGQATRRALEEPVRHRCCARAKAPTARRCWPCPRCKTWRAKPSCSSGATAKAAAAPCCATA